MTRYLPLLLFILASFSASAQLDSLFNASEKEYVRQEEEFRKHCPDSCHCHLNLPPWTRVGKGTIKSRIDTYKQKRSECQLDLADEVKYKIEGVIDLLTPFAADTSYDGFRAYIAVYPDKRKPHSPNDSAYGKVPTNQWGKLTLIYVPTKKDGIYRQNGKKYRRHIDQIAHCMIIVGDKAVSITAAIASKWIHKAEHLVLDSLQAYRQKKDVTFKETHSLWYSLTYVRDNGIHNGLLEIMRCRKCCHRATHVYAKFAAFPEGNVFHANLKYKLSLIFQLGIDAEGQSVSLLSDDLSKWGKETYEQEYGMEALAENSGGSDTGHPCPPPTPCNGTTAGALLPNP